MVDNPVYMVVNLIVTDADTYRKYEKGFFPILKKYQGEFVTYDDQPIHLEGLSPREGRMIIFKFPSEQAAKDWYADSDYQAISEFRRAGTSMISLTMVHCLPPK
ncbi:MAG: hypothetical protein VR65_28790 [Desulfobulbaceae bacterium BRH_c16a]|nr:MAG: hypothetical protein VR65_28790 [Desulfobulbaceae bacterium BRH_c16a]